MTRIFFMLALVVIGGCAQQSIPPFVAQVSAGERQNATLAGILETFRVQHELPGLRAAIRSSEGVIEAATGFADVRERRPLTTDMGMPGGSTGKTFVASVAMLLVEDGALDLDMPISHWFAGEDWYEELGPDRARITVSHLLSHTSGIRDHVDEPAFFASAGWRKLTGRSLYLTPREQIRFVSKKGLLFPPGEGYSYTDSGYLALGLVIEAVAGRDYETLLTERVLRPAGLSEARPARRDLDNLANGFASSQLMRAIGLGGRTLKRDGSMKLDPRVEWTGGGLTTTPRALVGFYHALANGEIVTPDSFRTMRDAGFKSGGAQGHYGYGMGVSENSFGHGGWFPGYRTAVRHFFAENLTIAVQTNTDLEVDANAIILALWEGR